MVITRSRVGDFDRFWSTFTTKGAELRAEHGSRGARAFRTAADPSEIWALIEMSREQFEAFLADPRAAGLFEEAGLEAPPEPFFVDEAGEARG